jgi:hypothetical protein
VSFHAVRCSPHSGSRSSPVYPQPLRQRRSFRRELGLFERRNVSSTIFLSFTVANPITPSYLPLFPNRWQILGLHIRSSKRRHSIHHARTGRTHRQHLLCTSPFPIHFLINLKQLIPLFRFVLYRPTHADSSSSTSYRTPTAPEAPPSSSTGSMLPPS